MKSASATSAMDVGRVAAHRCLMRCYRIETVQSDPRLLDCFLPDPGPGEVRVRIAACGLNFADLLMAEGRYQDTPSPPFNLGLEVAGTVEALGPGTNGPVPGTRVAVFSGSGGLAEAGNFPADRCIPLPIGMSLVQAAAFQVAYGTSHLALTRRAALAAGETLVVLGAAGGVGLTAVEIGKSLGARVVACARGAERVAVAARAGADHMIDTAHADLRKEIRALGGADVVYDPVGGEHFRASLGAVRPEARIVLIGFASGDIPQIPANHLLVKNVSVLGFYWGGYMRFAPDAVRRSLTTLLESHARGNLRPHIGHRLPLERVADGFDILRKRQATGKVVITMPAAGPEDRSLPCMSGVRRRH